MGGCCCFGVAIGILTNAAMTWLMYFADDGACANYMFWMMGSLSRRQPAVRLVVAGAADPLLASGGAGAAAAAAGETRPASWG